jgi:hypothetical protein
MTRPARFLRLLSLLLVILWLPAAGKAEEPQPPELVGIRVGFAGRYKVGLWTPVGIAIRGGTQALCGSLSATVADSDGTPCRVVADDCAVKPGSETLVTLYVRFGRLDGSLDAAFAVDGATVAQRTFHTAAEPDALCFREALGARSLIVAVGGDAAGLEEAAAMEKVHSQPRTVVASLDNTESLPTRWYGYEGVDTVVLFTSRPEVYGNLRPGSSQIDALDRWVRMGGRLVLAAGAHAEQVLGAGRPLARFAPGRLDRAVSLRQTGALESYAQSTIPIPRGEIPVARILEPAGKVEIAEADLPLVIRVARGFGQIVVLTADLDRPPLSDWKDRRLLTARLLDLTGQRADEESSAGEHFGYSDLAGQLRSALDRFDGVRTVSFSLVAVLAIVYLLLIGPGDYFLLRRVAPRMEWTWVTFPTIVLVFCVAAYVMAHRFKGDRLRIHQVDLVDMDAGGQVRGTSWLGLFSPRAETFNLALSPRLAGGSERGDVQATLAWLGQPGDGLGGMYVAGGRAAAPVSWSGYYTMTPAMGTLSDVPIAVWSTKSFTGRWWAAGAPRVSASLADEDQLPAGTITSKLAVPLEQCVLAYDRWAYDLGTLEPGRPARVGPSNRRTELRTLLTGRRLSFSGKQEVQEETSPYDRGSLDVAYVLRAMMFFQAAGGRRYTGLDNAYQAFVDLSGTLKAGQAVLVGYGPGTVYGAEVLRDGHAIGDPQDSHTTIYRFVLPVKPAAVANER